MPSATRRRPRSSGRREEGQSLYIAFLLGLARRFGPLYERLGVDERALYELLKAKLLLDDRRRRREGSSAVLNNVGFALMLVFYVFMGLLMGGAALLVEDPLVYLSVVASLVFLLLLFPLLADFSSILLDTSDIELLAPLPIGDRTLVAVRVTHLLGYVGMLMLALGAGPLLIGMFAYNPLLYVPIVLLALLQAAVLALAGVVAFYLFALKSLDLARFRDALVWVQAGTFVAFYAATQLGPGLAKSLGLYDRLSAYPELAFLIPTTAPGALLRLTTGEAGPLDPALCLSGFVSTLLVVGVASFLAREGIVSRLALLESSGGRALKKAPGHGISGRLGRRLARGPLERAGWSFFVAMSASDRGFKMRALPNFAFIVVPFLMMFLQSGPDETEYLRAALPYLPYLFLLIVPATWDGARFAEAWEGRWVLEELEPGEVGEFTRGAMKAAVCRFLLVPLGYLSLIVAFVVGLEGLPDLVLAFAAAFVATTWVLPKFGGEPPFTKKMAKTLVQTNIVLVFAVMGVGLLLGGLQFGLGYVPFAIPVLAPLALFGALRSWRVFSRVELAPKEKAGARRRKRRPTGEA